MAENRYQKTESLMPDPCPLLSEALAKHRAGDIGAAAQLYHAILDAHPEHPDALHMLGVIAQQMNKPDLALQLFDAVLKQKPDLALAWYNRALVLQVLKRRIEAWESVQRALRADPSLAEAWDIGGNLLRERGTFDESRAYHQRAVALNPDNAGYQANYSVALLTRGDVPGAYKAARAAARLDPAFLPITLGNALKAAGYPERAISCFEENYKLFPGHVEARVQEAMARLLIGDFERGLKLWETRTDMDSRYEHVPLWRGEKLRHLLLHEDQGLGDVLQCIRYIPLIRDRAEKITLQTAGALQKLLAAHFPNIICLTQDAPVPKADARARLLSLPYLCGTRLDSIPAVIPYLEAREEWRALWREKLRPVPAPRIGIIWAGNPANRNDHNRSLRFSQLAPLLKSGASASEHGACGHFVSLQKGKPKDQVDLTIIATQKSATVMSNPQQNDKDYFPDRRLLNGEEATMGIFDAAPFLDDFSATAGLIAELDLLVTADTAAAHLAGALGKPVWVMIPFDPDWRWMLGREDSPWYPTLRLFRQTKPGDWESVITNISAEAQKFIAGDQGVLMPKTWTDPPLRQNPQALALED